MLRWIIAAALLAAAGWSGWRSWRAARAVKAAKCGWTPVSAVITESRVEEVKTYDLDHRPVTVFEPRVAYEYEIGGARRCGRRIGLDEETFNLRTGAEKRLAAYPVGARVQALADPSDPDRSCLAAKADLNLFAPIAFTLAALLTASGVLGA